MTFNWLAPTRNFELTGAGSGPSLKADENGVIHEVSANRGSALLNSGCVPATQRTAPFTSSVAAAATAIAAISDAPTKAALTAVLAAVEAIISA